MLTIERLKEVFHYDPATGEFIRVDGSARKIGRIHEKGNIQTSIDGANYSLGRLAWLYVHGVLPFRAIHKNGDKSDLRIDNLELPHPSGKPYFGVGRLGEGPHSTSQSCITFRAWQQMLRRVHGASNRDYSACKIHPDFYEYQTFASWAVKQIGYGTPGFHIDKDLLSNGELIYSPQTCVFVPNQINIAIRGIPAKESGLPTGVVKRGPRFYASYIDKDKYVPVGGFECPQEASRAYLKAKQRQLTALADEWKDKIDPRAYSALLTFYGVEHD